MRVIAGIILVFAATVAHAQDGAQAEQRLDDPEADSPAWEFVATGYWNEIRGGDSYASGIFAADRGNLHLEARSNYEAIDSQSAFVGWTYSGGEALEYEVTPILGGVTGSMHGVIAGIEAGVAYGRLDYYIEAEFVRDLDSREDSFFYAWSELGFSPIEWLRAGIVAQRTRVYGEGREIERGGFAQVTLDKFTLGAYCFNPGDSDQVAIMSLGIAF